LEKISPIWTQTGAGGRNEKWRKMDREYEQGMDRNKPLEFLY
jgi:hypothetical protein